MKSCIKNTRKEVKIKEKYILFEKQSYQYFKNMIMINEKKHYK